MPEVQTVPLFVLPSGIFPMANEPLRVFEPRYKQMLDDCSIDELPFGTLLTTPIPNPLEGGLSLVLLVCFALLMT